jgi:hypothetical protein
VPLAQPSLLSSAHIESHFPATLSCQHLLEPPPAGSTMIQWSDGSTSTFSWTAEDATLVRLQSQTVITKIGQVVSGRFSGKAILENRVLLNSDLDGCATSGVQHLEGAIMFSIY